MWRHKQSDAIPALNMAANKKKDQWPDDNFYRSAV